MYRRPFVLCALLGVVSGASALRAVQAPDRPRLEQVKAAAARIRADDVLRDVSDLASDANMGRRTLFPGSPSPGYDAAAAYVARHLRELGITPMGDNGTYFQHYRATCARTSSPIWMIVSATRTPGWRKLLMMKSSPQ